jgi:outer membrane protein assembly factor BamB
MSLQAFINELQQRELLNERQLEKLSSAAVERQMTPRTLAKFLIQKGHLTQQQATDLLQTVQLKGGDVDSAAPTVISRPEYPAEPPELSLAPIDDATAFADSDDDEDAESSSIFASYLTNPTASRGTTSTPEEEEPMLLGEGDDDVSLEISPDRGRPKPAVVADPSLSSQTSIDELEDAPVVKTSSASAPAEPLTENEHHKTFRATTLSRPKKKSKKKTKPKGKKEKSGWDSPLILIGGGSLAALTLLGALIWWLMNWESGDQMLTTARAARDSGNYAEAIEQYQDFIAGASRHPQNGLAKIELAMLRIRQPAEAGDFEKALEAAQAQLKTVEDDEEFEKAHGELAALLPQIATGLAQQTEKAAPGSPDTAKFAELTNKALELCNNVNYLPKTMRDEAKLTAVREMLQLVERRNATKKDLDAGLAAMQESLSKNDTDAVYLTYAKLIQSRRELADDKSLAELLAKTNAAEKAAIKFVGEEQAAGTDERPTPWVAALALANRPIKPAAPIAGAANTVACFRVDGAVYALDAATGALLWRRHVGHSQPIWPQPIGADVLISDTVQNELVRVESKTGRLQWRQSIGSPFAQPLIVGDRAFVASDSGRLFVIDLNSGIRVGFVQFAQPLHVAPTVDRTNEHLYVVGDHSSLYTLLLKDLSCTGVFYLGHAEGSVAKAPVAVMDKVAVLENDGVETSRLRLLKIGDGGVVAGQVADRRLTGLAAASPYVAGRRVVVITDRGQVDVYEIGGAEGEEPLTLVATRAAPGNKPLVRFAVLSDRNLWIGDTQLAKYSILPTGNRLPVEAIENNFVGATFDHPMTLLGDTLLHVRRAGGRAGVIVTATETAQGRTLWETDLAVPPAGAPVVDDASKSFVVATAEGNVFRFDEAAIRSRVQDQPLAAEAMPQELPALRDSVSLGEGRAVFSGSGADQLLLYNPALGNAAAKWIKLDSPITAAATQLGNGIIVPLEIGQVFYLSAADGSRLATPFQPTLEPGKKWKYTAATAIEGDPPRFVIADGLGKIYLVSLARGPAPHLDVVTEADAGPHPIESPFVVLGDSAFAVGGSSHLLRVELPSLKPAGDSNLPAPANWGPYHAGDAMILATADNKLMAIGADGQTRWSVPTEHGDLIGAPLVLDDSLLVVYKNGVVERRSLADGAAAASKNLEQPLASGIVPFLGRFIVAGSDGTLLVIDQP